MPKFTVKKKAELTKRAAPVAGGRPVAFEVCSTRYKSSATGRFVPTPKAGTVAPKKARVNDYRLPTVSRGDGLSVLTIREKGGPVKSVKVRDLDARRAAAALPTKTGKRKAMKSVKTTERDLALIERSAMLGGVSADDHAEAMRDQFNSDKAKRGAVSRKRNAAARAADKKRNPYKYKPKAPRGGGSGGVARAGGRA